MFLFEDEQTKDAGLSIADALNAANNEIKNLYQTVFDFETKFMKVNREVLGQTAVYAESMTKAFTMAYADVVSMGGSLDDIASTFSEINSKMQSNTTLSSEQLTNFVALEKSTGLSAAAMGEMVEAFDTIGYGIDSTISTVDAMATKARSLGLNVGTFLTTVSKNIKLINAYNFKDGVEGFTRMVARAQSLRIDMTQVNKLAGDLLNPEKAVELAAEFQNLGGAIGALGDPFQLMNMAQNDMEGLQNAIVDAAKSSVMFNEKTGKFQISATEMRRLRAQADALGMSYEELANTAVKAAQEQRAMDDLRFTNLTDEQKQLISNLAQVNKNGELEITLPGMDKATKISELNSEMVGQYTKDLERIQKEEGLDALGVAKEQLGTLRDIAAALGGTAAKAVSGVAVSESFNDFKAQIREAADYTRDQLSEKLDVEKIGGKIDKLVEGGIGGLDAALGQLGIEGLSTSTIINGLVESIAGLKQKFQNWDPSGGGTGSGANSSNTPYSRENQGLKDASKTFSDLVDEKLRATGNTTELKDPFKLMEVAKNVRQNQELNITPTTNNTQQIEISDLNVNHTGTIRIEGITQTIDISRMSETDIRILSDRIKQVLSPELLGN